MRYNFGKIEPSTLEVDNSYIAETIEEKVRRLLNNKDDIGQEVPPIYTERKDGVLPQYDIRADKWDIALDAMTTASKTNTAKREAKIKADEEAKQAKIIEMKAKEDGKTESVDGTK